MVSDFPIEDGLMMILAKMVVNEGTFEANIKGRLHLQRHDTPWWKPHSHRYGKHCSQRNVLMKNQEENFYMNILARYYLALNLRA